MSFISTLYFRAFGAAHRMPQMPPHIDIPKIVTIMVTNRGGEHVKANTRFPVAIHILAYDDILFHRRPEE